MIYKGIILLTAVSAVWSDAPFPGYGSGRNSGQPLGQYPSAGGSSQGNSYPGQTEAYIAPAGKFNAGKYNSIAAGGLTGYNNRGGTRYTGGGGFGASANDYSGSGSGYSSAGTGYSGVGNGYSGAGSGYSGVGAGYPGVGSGAGNAYSSAGGGNSYSGAGNGYSGAGNAYSGAGNAYSGSGEDSLSEPANYEFSYEVNAPEYRVNFGHKENRQGDVANGVYHVLLPDGRTQIVEYQADEGGYKPKITYQGGDGAGGAGAGGYQVAGGYQGSGAGGYQGSGASGYQGAGNIGYQGSGASGYQGAGSGGYQGASIGGYQASGSGGYSGAGGSGGYQGSGSPSIDGGYSSLNVGSLSPPASSSASYLPPTRGNSYSGGGKSQANDYAAFRSGQSYDLQGSDGVGGGSAY